MMVQGFTEKDWKLFRKKAPDWQEAFMEKLTREYLELLSSEEEASEKFWKLEERIREDKKKCGVQMEMKRSNLIFNVVSLIGEGAVSMEELHEFSEEFQEVTEAYLNRRFRD